MVVSRHIPTPAALPAKRVAPATTWQGVEWFPEQAGRFKEEKINVPCRELNTDPYVGQPVN